MKKFLTISLLLLGGGYLAKNLLKKKEPEKPNRKHKKIVKKVEEITETTTVTTQSETTTPNTVDLTIDHELFTNAESLNLAVCEKLFEFDEVYNNFYKSEMDVYNLMLKIFEKNCKNLRWFHFCPKNYEEFVDELKEFGLYNKYEVLLEKIYQK